MSLRVGTLVSTDYLAARQLEPGLRVLDASWYMEGSPRDPEGEFVKAHIPGARRFNLDRAADPDASLPHTLPSIRHFAAHAGSCGVSATDEVVVYDAGGMSASTRAWWMFKVHGHQRVSVLDGGLQKWQREGRPVERGPDLGLPAAYPRRREPHRVVDMAAVAATANAGGQIVDARPAERFAGHAPEPRPGLRSGHIPGSANLPWSALVDPASGTFRPATEIESLFRAAGIEPLKPVICTCGSGVTACALALALEHIGNPDVAVYDGSWSEWATSHT